MRADLSARALLLGALLLASCAPASLEVLDPAASGQDAGDASVDAPAAADGTIQDVTSKPAPDVQPDAPSADAPGGDGTAPVGCAGDLAPCTFAGQCCSLACVVTGDAATSGSCGAGPACSSAGSPCGASADCCSNACAGGHCMMSSAMCKPAGEACGGNPECCGQLCTGGHCALLEGCRVQGEICGSSFDCCTALCVLDPQSVGHCAALPMCNENDHKPCTRQVGEICGGNDDCCSRECSMLAGGLKRCSPGGGCRSECELCSSGADCCSGNCSGSDEGRGVCQPAPTCGADGETCGGNPDCCPGATCAMLPPPSGAHRCLVPAGDAACRAGAATCAMPAECCSGFCLPGSTGFSCASTCVIDGSTCTQDADCCSAGSACMEVDGVLTCEPILP